MIFTILIIAVYAAYIYSCVESDHSAKEESLLQVLKETIPVFIKFVAFFLLLFLAVQIVMVSVDVQPQDSYETLGE